THKPSAAKGFTLIELLVVIAIVAILAVAVILTLNPAELLRQARDSTRISDMNTLKRAVSLYIADQSAATSFALGSSTSCYVSTISANTTSSAQCGYFTSNYSVIVSTTVANATKIDGTGWIPVKFTRMTAGSPVGALPVDPTNSAVYFYGYV